MWRSWICPFGNTLKTNNIPLAAKNKLLKAMNKLPNSINTNVTGNLSKYLCTNLIQNENEFQIISSLRIRFDNDCNFCSNNNHRRGARFVNEKRRTLRNNQSLQEQKQWKTNRYVGYWHRRAIFSNGHSARQFLHIVQLHGSTWNRTPNFARRR